MWVLDRSQRRYLLYRCTEAPPGSKSREASGDRQAAQCMGAM